MHQIKDKSLYLFTHPHVFPNIFDFFLSILENVHVFVVVDFYAIAMNAAFGLQKPCNTP